MKGPVENLLLPADYIEALEAMQARTERAKAEAREIVSRMSGDQKTRFTVIITSLSGLMCECQVDWDLLLKPKANV